MPQATSPVPAAVEVGIIAINDFHGALEPPRAAVAAPDQKGGSIPVPAGGAAWLASAVDQLKAQHPNHVVVAAGDLTSASQLASSLHLDEPAVGVMNRIGLEFNAVGNHEFDRGWKELQRLQNGGCEKNTRLQPCQLEQFQGAKYEYLSASTYKADGTTLFPATGLKSFGTGARKVTVGFIGLSLKDVPTLVSPDEVAGLTFGDEAEAINREVPKLKAEGADAVVVLIHQGGYTTGSDPNGCDELTGAIRPILDHLNPGVDLVVSGHTHWQYVCQYGQSGGDTPILLTSAGVYGKLVTDITLTIDPIHHRVIAKKAHNVIVQSEGYSSGRGDVPNTALYPQFTPRADIASYVSAYVKDAKDLIARPVGKLSGPAAKPSSESNQGGPLGNLIADGQLYASRSAGAQIAFTNPFGIRAPIDPAPDGTVTFGQIYLVQPFNNNLVTMTLTGAQVRAVIEDGLDDDGTKQVLAASTGLKFTFDMSRPSRSRVVSLTLNGKPVDPKASYRVTVVQFLAEGGDGFSTFKQGMDEVRGIIDNEAMQQWIAAVPIRQVPTEVRAVKIGD
ncbi:bifunctional metallophosphatase/5'-nucleotidase [Novosphingobium sp. 2580]|uniref:Bifunctional metallophosphatase/5'-nucleotidase n=2 Tax=Novosphingobium album (ex Hu et al. 2023) TaxID=2930093 RepID=A0ABT0B6E2_9SPHN|nr:bifunctional metallophosphatase/5'-nucleotidase [Novosphingobium album (ex Hu et al. 2023)]MCJ2180651.1 bifunctional metallophosphatase/5'-nucleotidase [Novosphingobium album (ex Hu et al. 2023)]